MSRTCLQFSEDELYHLWKNFANEPDQGAEALCGFMGLPLGAPASVVKPTILKFQKRAEKEADKYMIENELRVRLPNR